MTLVLCPPSVATAPPGHRAHRRDIRFWLCQVWSEVRVRREGRVLLELYYCNREYHTAGRIPNKGYYLDFTESETERTLWPILKSWRYAISSRRLLSIYSTHTG